MNGQSESRDPKGTTSCSEPVGIIAIPWLKKMKVKLRDTSRQEKCVHHSEVIDMGYSNNVQLKAA